MNAFKLASIIMFGLFLAGCLAIGYKFYKLSENKLLLQEHIAWQNCIQGNSQADAGNLVCRSLYPHSYKLFLNEFNQ